MQAQRAVPGQSVARFPPTGGTPQSSMRRPNAPPAQSGAHTASRSAQPNRKKKRFADKIISPQVRELVPECQAYMDLLAFEQKLDATMARKKLDIQEALKRPMKVKRRLRIYISHTFIPGKEPEKEGDEGAVPMWELRVEGRLLDDPANAVGAAGNAQRPATKRKFSSFFKSLSHYKPVVIVDSFKVFYKKLNELFSTGTDVCIGLEMLYLIHVIELDKDIYGPDNHLVEWHRTPQTNETDGFQVKRPGDRPVKCTILLLLDYQPMKFKLHPRLAKVLGIAAETRPKIIEALWQYIKTHKLQDSVDRDTINNDNFLEHIFNCKRMRFMEIPQRLHQLLQQPDPLVLTHVIQQNEGGAEKNTACYDIDVEVEDPLKQHMAGFVHNPANAGDIANLDQKVFDLVDQINEWKTRRDFYVRFADEPHCFISKWVGSQSLDLKTMTESSGENEAERKADFYYRPETQEGVFRYIYQKVQQKRAELEASLGVRNN